MRLGRCLARANYSLGRRPDVRDPLLGTVAGIATGLRTTG
jgi:hypothetical protein